MDSARVAKLPVPTQPLTAVFFVQAIPHVCDEVKQSAVVVVARLLNTDVLLPMAFERTKASAAKAEEPVEEVTPEGEEEVLESPPEEPLEVPLEEEPELEDNASVVLALQKENARLRRKNRKLDSPEVPEVQPEPPEPKEEPVVPSDAQSVIYSAWQEEALEDFLESHPEYEDDMLWKQFRSEWEDRAPIVSYAKKQERPVTRKLFMERFESIHRSLGGDVADARTSAARDALKAHSLARLAQSGSGRGSTGTGGEAPPKGRTTKPILRKTPSGFSAWVK